MALLSANVALETVYWLVLNSPIVIQTYLTGSSLGLGLREKSFWSLLHSDQLLVCSSSYWFWNCLALKYCISLSVNQSVILKRNGARAACLLSVPPPFCTFTFSLLTSSQISVAVVHVSDDPSQIHNDEIILSTERSVHACHIDLSALLINEVLRWKRWLHDNWTEFAIQTLLILLRWWMEVGYSALLSSFTIDGPKWPPSPHTLSKMHPP